MNYKVITVKDIIDVITANPELFPKGIYTTVCSGDFEGNYIHKKHNIACTGVSKLGNTLFLEYEMHEGFN